MHAGRLGLILLVALSCDHPPPNDSRGTLGQPFEVSVRAPNLAQELAPGLSTWGGLPIKETTNSADVTWRTEVKVGTGQRLTVVPSRGEPVVFSGAPLRADFYHVGRVLLVTEGEGDAVVLHNFLEPIHWYTTRAP